MAHNRLTQEQGAYLLKVARQTLEKALGLTRAGEADTQGIEAPPSIDWLASPGAAFVTLRTRRGDLRGCIGSLVARRPVIEDVRSNALAAAFEDPRFPPLTARELPGIVIDVSVLTAPEPLPYTDAQDLIRKLRPNVDGVIIERGRYRATFLPQVWEQLPVPEEFLTHLCHKAGLAATAWRSGDLNVSIYQVQEFEETKS